MRLILPERADLRRTAASTTIPTVSLIASATPHDDGGSWATLIASTAIEAKALYLVSSTTRTAATDTSTLLDLAIGPSGSPTPLVDDLQVGFVNNATDGPVWPGTWIPLQVPAGSEIIAKVRSAVASKAVAVFCDVYGTVAGVSRVPTFAKCRTIGSVPTSSRGTALTAPGGTNVKSAWTELEASAASTVYALGIGIGSQNDAAMLTTNFFLDIGIGGAGSEQIVVPDITFSCDTTETFARISIWGRFMPLLRPIAAGQRIAARYQRDAAQDLDLILYAYS